MNLRTLGASFACAITMLAYDLNLACAQNTVGGRLKSMNSELTDIKDFVLLAAALLGVIFLVLGIIKLTKRQGEPEGGPAKALIFIIAGALLTGIPTLLLLTSGTLLGDGESVKVTTGVGSF